MNANLVSGRLRFLKRIIKTKYGELLAEHCQLKRLTSIETKLRLLQRVTFFPFVIYITAKVNFSSGIFAPVHRLSSGRITVTIDIFRPPRSIFFIVEIGVFHF